MFGPQIAALKFMLRSMARRVTWGALGGILVLLGLIFFGIAAWVVLEREVGLLPALMIAGGFFVLLGLLALAWSRYPPRVVPRETAETVRDPMQAPALSVASIVNALVMGIAAGRAVRRRD